MSKLFRISFAVAAVGALLPLTAAAQSAYNGTYAGISATVSGGSHCMTPQTPGPLTITNGNAASPTGFFTGTVDAQGHVVLHTKESTRYEGQIDGSGMIKISGSTGSCTYTIMWRKR